ncbi:hypothetical protein [Kutzneria sp. CA-103260]|uniref:hypothetical protein n=1 Tax=Kutzneria sp. CA-103260 TaxID=2802641 RepID=UPI001BACB1E0|nr:hypothetical protein [Kutzneria sp. CA-103260]QUQ71159.1 hypothetical protein JJ691_89420 [Kutzneria sp. CA-103260]
MTTQPDSVTALVEWLGSSGFELTGENRGGMGGVQLIYQGALDGVAATVEIEVETGFWQALLKFEGMAKGRIPDVWAAYLDGAEVNDHDIDYEAEFIRERGAEAAAAWRRDPAADQKLAELGLAYMWQVQEKIREELEGP